MNEKDQMNDKLVHQLRTVYYDQLLRATHQIPVVYSDQLLGAARFVFLKQFHCNLLPSILGITDSNSNKLTL